MAKDLIRSESLAGVQGSTFRKLHDVLGLKLKKNGHFNAKSLEILEALRKFDRQGTGRCVRELIMYQALKCRREAAGDAVNEAKVITEKGLIGTNTRIRQNKPLGSGPFPHEIHEMVDAVISAYGKAGELNRTPKKSVTTKTATKKAKKKRSYASPLDRIRKRESGKAKQPSKT